MVCLLPAFWGSALPALTATGPDGDVQGETMTNDRPRSRTRTDADGRPAQV
jgi:hypothetical protein